jgi:hypothetical protein
MTLFVGELPLMEVTTAVGVSPGVSYVATKHEVKARLPALAGVELVSPKT